VDQPSAKTGGSRNVPLLLTAFVSFVALWLKIPESRVHDPINVHAK
jgi:hypothetical protein